VFLLKRTLTAETVPEMDNDQVGRVAAELDTRDGARGDVEKRNPGTWGTGSDSVPAGRRINEFTLRGEVASADGVPKGWSIRLVRLEDRGGIGEILSYRTSPFLLALAFLSFPSLPTL